MILELITNMSLLTAFLFLSNQFHIRKPVTTTSPLYIRLAIGAAYGLFGVMLMYFSVHIADRIILDFRTLTIMASAFFGGWVSSIATTVLIVAGRIGLFGGITDSSVVAASNAVAVGIACGVFRAKFRSFWPYWLSGIAVNMVAIIWSLIFLLGSRSLAYLPLYLTVLALGGVYVAYMIGFLTRTNALYAQLAKSAGTDYLTDLHNHRSFDTIFNELFTSVQQQKLVVLSLIAVDIDHFKKVNDTYGHAAGDAVLQQFGQVLKRTARSFDTAARIGGEEFAVLLPDCPHDMALQVAERIRAAVEAHRYALPDGRTIHITASLGVSTYPGVPADELLNGADQALYEAKRTGRNRVCSAACGTA
ncbi:GGDEF domain-containing protein [Paenibacillus flagellatus]|uniref:Diguanylate cyclase n=1 Tax=Paenibacillus flagellatus TaxID=2211139 RepID=A0A2V5K6L1_9BACL|nr:diguanylate cyclase [Paenibacillus flagellatus]PYI55011.1 diguanylate cyclase [Paenibacillus flagellatus]